MLFPQCLVLLLIIRWTQCASILGIFTMCSRSHYSIHKTIIDGLLSKGHEVTVISHFEKNSTTLNYTGIAMTNAVESFIDSFTVNYKDQFSGIWNHISNTNKMELPSCEMVLNTNYIKELINKTTKQIDLIIVEAYHTTCYHLLAHVLDVPLIIVLPPSSSIGTDLLIGNPLNPSYIPLGITHFTTKMNFGQRLTNTLNYIILYWCQNYVFNTDIERIARQYFHLEDLPSDELLHKRTSLVMYNNHFSFINRPKPPNVIDVGGIHIKPAMKLPKDLEEFIEQSPQGVILFSFGSTIKMSSMSDEKIKIFLKVFSSIPQRVLWRVDDCNFTAIPSNVKLSRWLPQRDLLEHPKVIAFISHAGLLGTLEAIYTATPVIAIPLGTDQFQNAYLLVQREVGVYVDYNTITQDTLSTAIKTILSSKYRENMQKLSRIFKNRPRPPLDEAMYWIEYVLEYKGATHLRTDGTDMPLHRYLLLDIIVLFIVMIASILFLVLRLVKIIIYFFFNLYKRK